MQIAPESSCHVSAAAFRTASVTAALLVCLLSVGEFAARMPAVRARLPAPSVGSPSRSFEQQLDRLDRFAERIGVPDCIVLGNSTAWMGVDPTALTVGYHQRTGDAFGCFCFGVAGMTASAAGALAPVLVQRYRPRTLLYLASPRDVGSSVDGPRLADTAWLKYHNGERSVAGWLTEHTALYRYYLLYRQWLDPLRWRVARLAMPTTASGFQPFNLPNLPNLELWKHTQNTYGSIMRQPLSPTELRGLEAVLQSSSPDTRVILIETPMHERLWRWSRGFSRFYSDALLAMRQAARHHRVPFRRVPAWKLIADDEWADFVHLNPRGAARFSEWLGREIAVLLQARERNTPSAESAGA